MNGWGTKGSVPNIIRLCLKIGYTFVLGSIVSCSHRSTRPQDKMIDRISCRYTSLIQKKFPSLQCHGVGAAAMTDVKELIYGFTSRQHLHPKEASRLVCECAEILLKIVNSDEKIRPYLSKYPFDSKNIRVRIVFSDGIEESFVPKQFVASASVGNGELVLWKYNPQTLQLEVISALPYKQATQKYAKVLAPPN